MYFYNQLTKQTKNSADLTTLKGNKHKQICFKRCLLLYTSCNYTAKSLTISAADTLTAKTGYNQVVLNFKRMRFYPLIRDRSGVTMFNCTLGVVSKFLNKGKAFTKKKAVYLLLFSLIRKILMYSKINNSILVLNRTPKYLQEFMATLHTPAVAIYSNPFKTSQLISESNKPYYFDFKYVQVLTSKAYGYIKIGKRGRLKRKISRRVQLSNRVLD